jgi:hypothetical protein
MPQGSFSLTGLGFRTAEELGLHRQRLNDARHTVEDEIRRRTFFVLLVADRLICSFIGRICYMDEEESVTCRSFWPINSYQTHSYDVELPTECDDEYWDNPDPALCFKQPSDRPSHSTFFILYIKLLEILGLALKGLYSSKKSKNAKGARIADQEHHLVAQLDSMLNAWVDTVPPHCEEQLPLVSF